MDKNFFIRQLDDILTSYSSIRSRAQYEDLSGDTTIEEITSALTRSKAAIVRIVGDKSEYYKDAEAILKQTDYPGEKLKSVIGIVIALKSDLQNDYLKSLSDIIQSEVFSNYLEMAEHLLNEGYKDPAAVLVGSTLEAHLRDLCISSGIAIEVPNSKGVLVAKKADVMNADLAKASVYSTAHQKQITAWLGIRNLAAHGKYTEYKPEEVLFMLQGVKLFVLPTK